MSITYGRYICRYLLVRWIIPIGIIIMNYYVPTYYYQKPVRVNLMN